MERHRVLVIVMLTVIVLTAGCTSSDDTADETTTAIPAATVAAPVTATTVATTTSTTTTSTTLSPAAAIATVEAFINARNAHDADAFAAFLAESAWTGETDGKTSHSWERSLVAFDELVGWQGTLSDCEADDGLVTCLVTSQDTLLSGKAGVVYTFEYEFRFDAQGLIEYGQAEILTGRDEYSAFDDAFGLWMMAAYPESFSTFYLGPHSEVEQAIIERTGEVYWRLENWFTPEGVAELSPLIDEFVAQSDEYPLSDAAATEATATPVATELRLTFDGDGCTYGGPTELTPGPVELVFLNESEGAAAVNMVSIDEGYTVQDVIDDLGPEPSTNHHPYWTHELGTWRQTAPGESHRWEGDLEAGLYAMVCARLSPLGGWFGTGLTVEG